MQSKWVIRTLTVLMIIVLSSIILLFIKAYFDGNFSSKESLQSYIKSFGVFGPMILTLIQAMQVIIPILPGFLGCAVGGVLFGWAGGFACNYIGISVGSVIAYFLARRFGVGLVKNIFPEKKYNKFSTWAAESKSYTAMLFAGMILLLFPDDFFCYFTGLTKMSSRKFIIIIILGKPWCLLAYSVLFSMI